MRSGNAANLPRDDREGTALQVEFRGVVVIAHAERQGEVRVDAPFVLHEARVVLAADIRRRLAELQILVRRAPNRKSARSLPEPMPPSP